MDGLEFLARSEWPAVTVFSIWLLRRPLVELVERLNPTKINAWGFKAEFERTLSRVEQRSPARKKVVRVTTKDHAPPGPTLAFDQALPPESGRRAERDKAERPGTPVHWTPSRKTADSPEAAILLAWADLEALFRELWRAKHGSARDQAAPSDILRIALELGFDGADAEALGDLRTLRNAAAHQRTGALSWDDADRFVHMTEALAMAAEHVLR